MVQLVEQWAGRPVDILTLDIGQPTEQPKPAGLGLGQPVRMVAGVQQLVQTFITLLYTRLGTAANPTLGTNFLTALMQGRVRTESDLRNHFTLAASLAGQQINQRFVAPDTRMASAVLLSSVIERQRIIMRVRIISEAGPNARFLVPLERIT